MLKLWFLLKTPIRSKSNQASPSNSIPFPEYPSTILGNCFGECCLFIFPFSEELIELFKLPFKKSTLAMSIVGKALGTSFRYLSF